MTTRRWLWTILIGAFVLRVIVGLAQDARIENYSGGDSLWYWRNGYVLVSGDTIRYINGVAYDVSRLDSPPIYFVVIGLPQLILPSESAVIAVRLFQAALGTLIAYCAYRIGWRISRQETAGLIAAGIVAVSPTFILETAQITTETVFMALLACGMMLYVESLTPQPFLYAVEKGSNVPPRNAGGINPAPTKNRRQGIGLWVTAAVLLGLASLTRVVLLAFPFALAAFCLIAYGFRRGIGRALVFSAVYFAVVLTWTAYNVMRWDRFVLGGQGLPAFLYVGATGWADPTAVDTRLNEQVGSSGNPTQDTYVQGAADTIAADPVGYARRRVTELASAILQPHGTTYFSGESLRDLAANWLRDDRTLSGFLNVVRGDQFGIKLVLYLFHYGTLILGLIGIWRTRHSWQLTVPLIGYIAYTAAIHLFLLALPRYWFPTMIFWAVFAACALVSTRKDKAI